MTTKHLFAICLVVGCGVSEVEDDPPDEQVIGVDGKADAFGYKENSPEAFGILEVANEVPAADLQSKVGLTKQARTYIVAGRTFGTLAALDAAPYVGQVTFAKLLAYARDQGWVHVASGDPFDAASCTGPALTQANAVKRFQPGATEAKLGAFTVAYRKRSCNSTTGCGPWSAVDSSWALFGIHTGVATLNVLVPGTVTAVLAGDSPPNGPDFNSHCEFQNGNASCGGLTQSQSPLISFFPQGVIEDGCLRVTASDRVSGYPNSVTDIEYEMGILARY